jgi:glycosyltransferase involved in cell wall biosynthesis
MQNELHQRAQALRCANRVHFTGLLNPGDVIKVLNEVDLLLMPSGVDENFGMAALEALAAGVPVLTSDHVPVGRWAAEAGAGLALSGDPKILSDAAGELLANPIRLAEMGARGRELARQKFDRNMIACKMLDHYHSILKTGTPVSNDQVI